MNMQIVALVCALAAFSSAELAFGSEGFFERNKEVAPVTNAAYQEECSACHYAYPPGLLVSASWQKLLAKSALSDHFGENNEMSEGLRIELLAYATKQAAENSDAKRSRKVVASLGDDSAPLKITDVPYIHRKHQKIPEEQIKGNLKVVSLAQCDTCHTKAAEGSFDDDSVVIPGYGRWQD